MKYEDLKYLSTGLPEDVEIARESGEFGLAEELIDARLKKELPYALRARLELEKLNLKNLRLCYTVTEEELITDLRRWIPDFTSEDLQEQKILGRLDWIMLDGKPMYQEACRATLLKVYPDFWARSEKGDESDYSMLTDFISSLEDGQTSVCHIHIRHTLTVPEEISGENAGSDPEEASEKIRIHMPLPIERGDVKNVRLLKAEPDPDKMPSPEELQPTVYYEKTKEQIRKRNGKFSLEYQVDNVQTYVDLADAGRIKAAGEGEIPEEAAAFLGEEPPHIRFTDYLRELAKEICGEEKNPLCRARKIYDYITTKVEYRFVRNYACIDQIPEYAALNQKGDCGVMALLFITLCRISGIPAAWQSGLDAKPGDIGEHDWARFYVPGTGWRYADLSYGASSYIRGLSKNWNYFFGNVDPFRIPVNDAVQKEFDPPKKFWRADPYDNQCGEIETESRGLFAQEFEYSYEEMDIHLLSEKEK